MSALPPELLRDRVLRNAALTLFKTDIAQFRADISGKGLGERLSDRIGEGAKDMAEEAAELAERNPGKIAAVIAGLALWLFRGPLLDWLFGDDEHDTASEHSASQDHWDNDPQFYGDEHD